MAEILRLFDTWELVDGWDSYGLYSKLDHPGLADPTSPIHFEKDKNFLVRRVAIDIAEACEVRELQDSACQSCIGPETGPSCKEKTLRLQL